MGTPPPLPEPVRGLRLEERAPSITTLIVDAVKAVSSASAGPVCAPDLLTAIQVDAASLQPARFSGFAADAPNASPRPRTSPFASAAAGEEGPRVAGASSSTASEDADLQEARGAYMPVAHADALTAHCHQLSMPSSPFESRCVVGDPAPGFASQGTEPHLQLRAKQHSESAAADFTSRQQQQPPMAISPHYWSPSSMQGHHHHHWEHANDVALRGQPTSDPAAVLALPLSAPLPLSDPAASGHGLLDLHLPASAAAAATLEELHPHVQLRLQALLPEVLRGLLPGLIPALLPAALAAALPAASSAAATGSPAWPASLEALLPGVLAAALPPALATTLPKAITAALNVLFKAAAAATTANTEEPRMPPSALPSVRNEPSAVAAATTAAAVSGERQQSTSLEQQCAAEAQLVRMLFGADGAEAPPQPHHQHHQQQQLTKPGAVTPGVVDVTVAIASGGSSRVASPNGSGSSSPAEQLAASRPPSVKAAAAPPQRAGGESCVGGGGKVVGAVFAGAPARRPSVAAFAGATSGASISTAAGDMFSRRLSDTNYSTSSGASAAAAAAAVVSRPQAHFPAVSVKVPGGGGGGYHHAAAGGGGGASNGHSHGRQQQPYCRSSGGSGGGGDHSTLSLGHPEDALSSGDDALSICSGAEMPSPYTDLCIGGAGSSALGTGGAVNSSANSFLLPGGSGCDITGADALVTDMYGIRGDVLLDRLHHMQQQSQQQHNAVAAAAAGGGGMGRHHVVASPAELLMAAARGGGGGGVMANQHAQHAAALFAQQQQHQQQQRHHHHHHQQQQAQQQAQAQQEAQQAAACAQQFHQLQQLQAFVSGHSLSDQDLGVPPSPPLSSAGGGGGGGVQWRRTSGTDVGFGASTGDLWQSDADALGFAAAAQMALGQQQHQQHQAMAAGILQQQQQQQLLAQSIAAVTAANVAGRAVRAEDFLAYGAGGSACMQLPGSASIGGQAAAAQLAAAAAAAAAGGGGAGGAATDLASYMDAALRRMLLVSPQVAAELARACSAFSGAHAQLHHMCCVIAEQLLDVAAMAPEVAAALLRALAAHRARGAQATDVDPRVMGRILQLLRAGPAGRQLCLVSLEQWVDGLSRIHKRRAYLDTILHNYQLTLKRLVQAMGHQVHAVNMSLPRQLLNDLSPRALLLLTAELAPYPLLQPRRWSEEIIWTVTQMHTMGVEMPSGGVSPSPVGGASHQASPPTSAFQLELRRALAATADDIAAAGGAAAACGQSPPGAGGAGPLAGLVGLGGGGGGGGGGQAGGSGGSTTPGGTAVPWAAHAALHRHLLMGLRRVQLHFFSDRLRKMHGLYGDSVEALLRSSLPQDVLVPEREVVVLVAVLLMLECRMRPDDFDAAFGRDLQRCLAVASVEEVAARLRCGLVPDSPLRLDPHKSRALSQLLKMGTMTGQTQY